MPLLLLLFFFFFLLRVELFERRLDLERRLERARGAARTKSGPEIACGKTSADAREPGLIGRLNGAGCR